MIDPIDQLLRDAGFSDGWVLSDGVLVLWEHDAEPPAPLVRPSEAPTAAADSAE